MRLVVEFDSCGGKIFFEKVILHDSGSVQSANDSKLAVGISIAVFRNDLLRQPSGLVRG